MKVGLKYVGEHSSGIFRFRFDLNELPTWIPDMLRERLYRNNIGVTSFRYALPNKDDTLELDDQEWYIVRFLK